MIKTKTQINYSALLCLNIQNTCSDQMQRREKHGGYKSAVLAQERQAPDTTLALTLM